MPSKHDSISSDQKRLLLVVVMCQLAGFLFAVLMALGLSAI